MARLGVLYGPSGSGKTTDLLYAFPNALILGIPAAVSSSFSVLGIEPSVVDIRDLGAAKKYIQEHGKKFTAIGIDDWSLFSSRMIRESKLDGHKLWAYVLKELMGFCDAMRDLEKHVVFSMHERTPDKEMTGPALNGQAFKQFPAACDYVLRVVSESRRPLWPHGYQTSQGMTNAVAKVRGIDLPQTVPMNYGEILRHGGFTLPRYLSTDKKINLSWMDEWVDKVTKILLQFTADEEVGMRKEIAEKMRVALTERDKLTDNVQHVRWVLRDAVDRAALLRYKQARALDTGF